MTVDILTFGCRLNAYESEVMRGHAAGLDDTIIVNTCAVTAEAERQARQAIRRAARERPEARIVVTGCAAQIDPGTWAALPGVARVLGNAEKLQSESWAADAPGAVGDIMAARETAAHLVTEFAGRARAFVQVQQGCDHRCTFCVIPYGRGPNRSVPVGAVVAQARTLVDAGYPGTGADRRRYRELRRRPAGAPQPRPARAPAAGAGSRSAPTAPLLARPGGDRCGSLAADRGAAEVDAASAPVLAGRQRPDPQAHEAAPPDGRRPRRQSRGPARCGRASPSAPT